MPKKTGRVTVSLGGVAQESLRGAELDLGGLKRTAMMSMQGTLFYTEEPVPSVVKFTLIHSSESAVRELADMVDVSLTFKCDSGTTYAISGALCTNTPVLKNGEVPFEFAGRPAEEIR